MYWAAPQYHLRHPNHTLYCITVPSVPSLQCAVLHHSTIWTIPTMLYAVPLLPSALHHLYYPYHVPCRNMLPSVPSLPCSGCTNTALIPHIMMIRHVLSPPGTCKRTLAHIFLSVLLTVTSTVQWFFTVNYNIITFDKSFLYGLARSLHTLVEVKQILVTVFMLLLGIPFLSYGNQCVPIERECVCVREREREGICHCQVGCPIV